MLTHASQTQTTPSPPLTSADLIILKMLIHMRKVFHFLINMYRKLSQEMPY